MSFTVENLELWPGSFGVLTASFFANRLSKVWQKTGESPVDICSHSMTCRCDPAIRRFYTKTRCEYIKFRAYLLGMFTHLRSHLSRTPFASEVRVSALIHPHQGPPITSQGLGRFLV